MGSKSKRSQPKKAEQWEILPSQRRLLQEMDERHKRELQASMASLIQHQRREKAQAIIGFKAELGVPEEVDTFDDSKGVFLEK